MFQIEFEMYTQMNVLQMYCVFRELAESEMKPTYKKASFMRELKK